MDQDKRRHRELKRSVKKAGKRKVRRDLQRDLRAAADGQLGDDSALTEIDYGRYRSEPLNGIDRDTTRRRWGRGSADEQSADD
ncbi:MAG: hypothetical protein SNJ82_08585 [Gemmataceae bacterium]